MKGGRLMFRQKDKFQKRNKRKEKRKRKILYSCALAGIAVVCIGAFSLSYGWIKNSLAGENTAQEEMKEKLKEAIKNFIEQPYYRTCGHCTGMQGLTSKAAEQGYIDLKKPILSKKM